MSTIIRGSDNFDSISSLKGFKNILINGGFDIWQRGVSFNISGNTFTADRWYVSGGDGASTSTISRIELEEEVYNILNTPYALSWKKTVAGTGPGWIKQSIENGAPRFAGKTVTLSFWARAFSGSLDLNIITYADYGSGGSAGETIETKAVATINTSAWNKYVVTLTFPDFADKTINASDNNIQLFFAPDNANSLFDFQITNVQLEEGTVATPFEQRPIGLELSLCQRYYYKDEEINGIFTIRNSNSNGALYVNYPQTMRVLPSISFVSVTPDVNLTSSSVNGARITYTGAIGSSTITYSGGITADAEL